MTSALADHFLKDLEDLSDSDEEEVVQKTKPNKEEGKGNDDVVMYDSDDEPIPDAIDEYLQKKSERNGGQNQAFSKLRNNLVFLQHLENLDTDLNNNQQLEKFVNLSRNDQIYELIVKTNEYLRNIDQEIMNVHTYVRDMYARKFSELEQIILNPIDYAKAVKIIGNASDVNKVIAQFGWLPNTTIMSVTVAFSASTGKPLSDNDLNNVIRACDEIIYLNDAKDKMLNYLSNRMHLIAPNLCEIVGSTVASKLIASAGGIVELAKIPACNIQVLGSQKKALHGLSTAGAGLHRGHIGELDVVKNAPQKYQIQAVRMLSTKCALAARVDACRTHPDGKVGKQLRNQILIRFDKIQAPQQPKLRKALPKPDDKPRKKRGGKKVRKMKEKYAMTMLRKEQNRMTFGTEQQVEHRETGFGHGTLGVSGGKLRRQEEKNQRILQKRPNANRFPGGSSGATNGMASSLVMGPMQGMELINPDLLNQPRPVKKDNYFSQQSGFSTVLQTRMGGSTQSTYNSNMIL